MVLNKRRDVENGIRALLREVGLKVGTPSRKDFPARARELTADEPVLASLAESLLSVVEVMTKDSTPPSRANTEKWGMAEISLTLIKPGCCSDVMDIGLTAPGPAV